ncbi:MAG TPA: hypothetical protein DEB25_09535 [Desulfobulbaceae bacterium]|nr:hypothetical protein [Desulfobulbaceae bacterium]
MPAMSFLVFFLVAVVLVVIQTTFFHALPLAWGRPDLVFVLVVFAAYRFSWLSGLLLVFCAAWMLEVTASLWLGIYAIQCLAVFVFLKTITHNIPIKESIYQIPLGILAFVLSRLFSFFVAFVIGQGTDDWSGWPLLRDTLWFAVMSWGLFMVFDALLSSMERFSWHGHPVTKNFNGRRSP